MNVLSKDFTYWSLLRFALPTVVMLMFMSVYVMTDGVFVSNLVNEDALSAINIVYPVQSVIFAIGCMMGAGGSAVIAKKMGEGRYVEARENFTLVVMASMALGIVFIVSVLLFSEKVLALLGSTPKLHDYCVDYLLYWAYFTPFAILQVTFEYLFVAAGKPKLGLAAVVAGGVANIFLDYLFIGPLHMGIAGAAVATGIGYSIPSLVGLGYFFFGRKGTLFFVRPRLDMCALAKTMTNGSSTFIVHTSTAVVTYLYNLFMLRTIGEDGVAAITIVLYAHFLMTAVYSGFSSGIAPVFSYNYGEKNTARLKSLFKMALKTITVLSVCVTVLSMVFSGHVVGIFVRTSSPVFPLAHRGLLLYATGFVVLGYNAFSATMFAALSNGRVSAIISFLRTFGFLVVGIFLLPLGFGQDGVWLTLPFAEGLTFFVSLWLVLKYSKTYGYL